MKITFKFLVEIQETLKIINVPNFLVKIHYLIDE